MLSYKQSLEFYDPSPQLGTMVAAHRYLRERNTWDDTIDTIEELLKITPDERSKKFRQMLDDYEFNIDKEQKIIDNPDTDPLERRRAVGRRDYARRQLGKKIDSGVVQPGTGDLRGVVEDDIDSMTSLVHEAVDEFEEASEELRTVRGWRDVYLEPIERKERMRANIGRYDLRAEELRLAEKRLRTAVAAARNAGRDVVTYTPTASKSVVNTISEAEHLIATGQIPEQMIPVLENELRIARRRQAAAATRAAEAGRTSVKGEPLVSERTIKYSIPGRAEKRSGKMSLAEAEAELARYPEYKETLERAKYRNQMDFEQMEGLAEPRIATLEVLLHDLEAPLNDVGIRKLKEQAREIDNAARARPGSSRATLASKRTAEEQAQLDLIQARIEQSTNAPDPSRTAAMTEELEYRTARRDEYHRTMAYDYELMGNVENNGYRLLRELTENMRAPTEAEARFLRQILGGESGAEVTQVLNTLDDYLGERVIMGDVYDQAGELVGEQAMKVIKTGKGYVTEERMSEAIEVIQRLAESRRLGDDALDRILPPDAMGHSQAGRALNQRELAQASQTGADIEMVLSAGGRRTQKTVDPDGFREQFFQTLVEQARNRRRDAENEIKQFTSWLDLNVGEDVFSVIGIVNKYFGGKLRQFTKAQKAEMRAARQADPEHGHPPQGSDPRSDHRGDAHEGLRPGAVAGASPA